MLLLKMIVSIGVHVVWYLAAVVGDDAQAGALSPQAGAPPRRETGAPLRVESAGPREDRQPPAPLPTAPLRAESAGRREECQPPAPLPTAPLRAESAGPREECQPPAPLPTAPAPAPSPLAAGPSPLPLRPTTQTVTYRTFRTVPSTSSSPITDPTTATPVTKTTTAARTSTAVSTTSTTTLASTTTPKSVPTISPTPVPTSTFDSTPSDEASTTSAPPCNVCEEMGLVKYEWEEATGQCYRFHPYGATWQEANATCAAEGAALAVANSYGEASLFTRLLRRHLRSGIRGARFKGAVALGFYWDQEWKTVDGLPLEQSGYAKWWAGWPRGEERARGGFMEHTGRLENYAGSITTPFICEAAP